MKEKQVEETKESEDNIVIKIVQDDFPIENYLDAQGNRVVCIKKSDAEAQQFANLQELIQKVDEISKILNV